MAPRSGGVGGLRHPACVLSAALGTNGPDGCQTTVVAARSIDVSSIGLRRAAVVVAVELGETEAGIERAGRGVGRLDLPADPRAPPLPPPLAHPARPPPAHPL